MGTVPWRTADERPVASGHDASPSAFRFPPPPSSPLSSLLSPLALSAAENPMLPLLDMMVGDVAGYRPAGRRADREILA